jgi:CBS domain-containing protein
MQVQEIMTAAVECCTPEDTAQKSAEIMKNADTGVVPVLAAENNPKVLGIVTDRDLCLSVVAAGRNPREVQVRECMSARIVACRPEDDVRRIAGMMADNQVRRMPVVDNDGGIVGIVSLADITREGALEAKSAEALREISEPSGQASKPRERSH